LRRGLDPREPLGVLSPERAPPRPSLRALPTAATLAFFHRAPLRRAPCGRCPRVPPLRHAHAHLAAAVRVLFHRAPLRATRSQPSVLPPRRFPRSGRSRSVCSFTTSLCAPRSPWCVATHRASSQTATRLPASAASTAEAWHSILVGGRSPSITVIERSRCAAGRTCVTLATVTVRQLLLALLLTPKLGARSAWKQALRPISP
jgi:hypothetical protein